MRFWLGNERPDFSQAAGSPNPLADPVSLSAVALAAQKNDPTDIESSLEAAEADPRLALLREMIYLLTGREAQVFDPAELQGKGDPPAVPAEPAAPRAGFGLEYDHHESIHESKSTEMRATGVVRTADGREIAFSLSLSMQRSFHQESHTSLRLGDTARPMKDPLVLNFSGQAATLTDQRFSFDLDADGNDETLAKLAPGSAFLVFDRNGDGVANNGSELFGPQSGAGFNELRQLDGDGNGWIDSADPEWSRLALWQAGDGPQAALVSLDTAGVGAIAVTATSTPFALRDHANAPLGQVQESSVWLTESGEARPIQQIDFSV